MCIWCADIATAVSFGATFAAKPTVGAFQELIHCLSYLQCTSDIGLVLHVGDSSNALTLRCYVDASYLTHRDSKSHSGYCMSFGTIGTFYSKSSKQSIVATLSTHAELRALYSLVIDIIYVIHLCDELGRPISLPAIILEDNQPAIQLSDCLSSRTKHSKHFLMLVNYIREQVHHGYIKLVKVPTEDNIVDILTKVVVGAEFRKKADAILGHGDNM